MIRDGVGKYAAVVSELAEKHAKGQPVLVGTISVEESENLSRQLDKSGVPHEVLNAKQHDREASIITQAGRLGSVTVATNMAGRGVDILLGGNPEGLAKQEMLKEVEQTESAMKSLLGDKIYDTMVDNVNKTTLASVAVSDFFNKCLSGFFLSLIVAAFLKRNPPPSEEII